MNRGRAITTGLLLFVIAALIGLGVWQLERRTWKLALIAHTEAMLAQPPVPAPGPDRWPAIGKDDVYRPVVVRGHYRTNADTLVQAVTELGGGFWVMTPFDTDRGFTLLVNRGFVPADRRTGIAPSPAMQSIRGLLRLSEPGGAFLRTNDPAADRWYSRDIAAIAARRGLGRVAPYFIDASEPKSGWPRGGLTVVRFRNSHLVYALTWFGLAALVAAMAWRVRRRV
ncbi:SURF1 family protein [Sphingomonas sp. NIC1]|uniref:SURF1 family protein n=1 Tax=Sphingomonas sp. NIC1 TaxID=1961362 RepID=UPI0007C0EDD1|nr:SURF1 family protein [Sphingomonas sp. NIC1]ANC87400.1 Surfeit locus 1 family protein [Sphingomonas sp. NIC1]